MANPRILYENRLLDAAPVASTTAAGFNVLNLRDWRNYTYWQPTTLPATVTVDCGSSKSADYAVFYGHNLFTKGCTVEIRKSTDNFAANDVLVGVSTTPASDDAFAIFFASTSSRYWRIKITGSAAPFIAIAAVGNRLELPYPPDDGFDPVGRQVVGQSNRSEQGNPLGTVILFEEWRQTVSLSTISKAFVRSSFIPAWKAHMRSSPFIFMWEADTYPGDLRYVQASGKFGDPYHWGDQSDLSFEIAGVMT
jgi:hypothetical protein